jgi:N-acetylglucosamine malate deacetylase 1
MSKQNILVVAAHCDDLELGCGGTIAKLSEEGHKIICYVMTNSEWKNENNEVLRKKEDAFKGAKKAAEILGYELIIGEEDAHDILVRDTLVLKLFDVINRNKIDTIFTHWHDDYHIPHWRINQLVLNCCKKTPRVLGYSVNWYLGRTPFAPNFFISISETQWNKRIEALKCYTDEYKRVGKNWVQYLDNLTQCYGQQIGTHRAEGFHIYKFRWDINE